jgi:CRP-like cAMP-binding protein
MAAADALLAHFLHVEMFRGLKPLQITEIARRAERIVFRPGQILIESGQIGDAALLVISDGAVRTRGPDQECITEPIEPGSLIGEMAMLVEAEHSSTVVAQGSVRAFRITRESLAAQMSHDASMAEHFVDKIAGRLHRLADELKKIETSLGRTVPAPTTGHAKEGRQLLSGAAG